MKIAITGGIGSGKSFVCRELAKRGIEVYDCDAAAKRLMRSDEQLQAALKLLVGDEVYADGVLQKPVLAQFLLASETNKLAVNDVVHPAVARDFEQSGKNWLESAILFDSGFVHRTLFASYKKGNRPSWYRAAKHEISVPLYEEFCKKLSEALGKPVGTGEFGADMKVELLNDGPVTIMMDTHNKE